MKTSSLAASVPDPFDLDDWHPDMAEPRSKGEAGTRQDRLPAWREALQAGVTSASPALFDMAAERGIDLVRAARRLRPPVSWTPGAPLPAFTDPDDVWPYAPDPQRRVSPWGRNGRYPGAPRVGAVPPDHPDGPFVVALNGATLCGCARIGGATLLTDGGLLQLWFEQALPDTLMMAAVGEFAGRVVGHPVLTGRSYPVVNAMRKRSWTVLEVATDLVPVVMPWPHLTAGAAAEDGA